MVASRDPFSRGGRAFTDGSTALWSRCAIEDFYSGPALFRFMTFARRWSSCACHACTPEIR
jgi:hypothetical protein